jgi:hypothetical protein
VNGTCYGVLPVRQQDAEAARSRKQAARAEPWFLQASTLRPCKISPTKKKPPASPKGLGLIKLQRAGMWIVVAQNSSAWFLGDFCRLGERSVPGPTKGSGSLFNQAKRGTTMKLLRKTRQACLFRMDCRLRIQAAFPLCVKQFSDREVCWS